MVTNNVRDLQPNRGNYSFILNAQGRIQGDITVFNRGDFLVGETESEHAGRIKEFFDRFIIMDDVEVTDVTDKLSSIGIVGPMVSAVLERVGLLPSALAPGQIVDANWRGIGYSLLRDPVEASEMYEIWVSPESAREFLQALAQAGATPVGDIALEWFRILRGVPLFGTDISERELPQETAQMHVLHYTKGCYIGQEIVERIHARGNVHRTFTGFELEGPSVARGTKIVFGDKEVGEITSSAQIPLPDGERVFALGYVRREAATPGTEVKVGEVPATVSALPFAIS